MIEGAPGHGEGHNSGVPLNIIAALAVKKVMEREHLQGHASGCGRASPRNWSAPRLTTCAPGMFKDVDVVLFAHVAANLGVS